jgi:hypothetical protein
MAIIPDTKDWTWVTERPCTDCGFDPTGVTPGQVGSAVRETIPRWQSVLGRPQVAERSNESIWSGLEYAAHVRDVCKVFEDRLALMLSRNNPNFADWNQDAAAIENDYGRQDPGKVSQELEHAALSVSAAFDAVVVDQWERQGVRSNGSIFTVTSLGAYFLHDVLHHLHDVNG